MRQFILIIVAVMAALAAWPLPAAAACPLKADRLEDFAGCMVPMRGVVGTATVYTGAGYDQDHAELMNAMASQPVVPQQVMPAAPMPYYPIAYMALSPYIYSYHPAFWASYMFYRMQ